jgi:NO-binding membrane sensor protein with MHYT domain
VIRPKNATRAAFQGFHLTSLPVFLAGADSYAAPDTAGRVTAAGGWPHLAGFTPGAPLKGIGIGLVRCIGMHVFRMPVGYYRPAVLLSMPLGIMVLVFAPCAANLPTMGSVPASTGSVILRASKGSMGPNGISALRLTTVAQLRPPILSFFSVCLR